MIPSKTLAKLFSIGTASIILILMGNIMIGFALEFWFVVELLSINGKAKATNNELADNFKRVFGKNDTDN